jgi:acyl-CoA synthetase (AMP-forming)/AMP-acid ligase II
VAWVLVRGDPLLDILAQLLGVQLGDRIGVMLPGVAGFPVACYRVLRAGGVVVPVNPR